MRSREYQDIHCPSCGWVTKQKLLFAKNGCEIFRCEGCGLGRAATVEFDADKYYTHDYFSGGYPDGYADYLGSKPVLHREFTRDVEFIRQYRRCGRLVEIGCAYGFFLQQAKRCFDVAGIELAPDAGAYCRHNALEVITGTATAENLKQLGPADIFVLLDVIEHLPDPFDTLARCVTYLKPGGLIILTTGDFGSPIARLTGARWRLMTPPQHLWFFTKESFRRWARRFGMRIEEFHHPWKLVPLSLIGFQLVRTIGLKPTVMPGSGIAVPVNLFDAMRIVFSRVVPP
jgi:2-polyprenyl-3-methyl-5-hydroxy-6-metoxy-1,4-benzoquinol methylase